MKGSSIFRRVAGTALAAVAEGASSGSSSSLRPGHQRYLNDACDQRGCAQIMAGEKTGACVSAESVVEVDSYEWA